MVRDRYKVMLCICYVNVLGDSFISKKIYIKTFFNCNNLSDVVMKHLINTVCCIKWRYCTDFYTRLKILAQRIPLYSNIYFDISVNNATCTENVYFLQ